MVVGECRWRSVSVRSGQCRCRSVSVGGLQGSEERQLSLLLEARDAGDGDGGRLAHWMVAVDWHLADRLRLAWAARWDTKVGATRSQGA